MAPGEEMKCTQEKKNVKRMVHGRDERQGEQSSRRRHRRNQKMERYESGCDGLMLENLAGKMEDEVLDKYKVEF